MIRDISLPIGPGLPTWPGDASVEVRPTERIAAGDEANVSEIRLGTHTGTHVDPPFHFVEGGQTVDRVALDVLIGDAFVADLVAASGVLAPDDLERAAIPSGTTRLLLRTANSRLWANPPTSFPSEYVSIGVEAARWIVRRGIRLVGADFLSIEAFDAPGHPVHRVLLEAGLVVVEGLDLSAVEPARGYGFACLPLRIVNGDGAPARAVLIDP